MFFPLAHCPLAPRSQLLHVLIDSSATLIAPMVPTDVASSSLKQRLSPREHEKIILLIVFFENFKGWNLKIINVSLKCSLNYLSDLPLHFKREVKVVSLWLVYFVTFILNSSFSR